MDSTTLVMREQIDGGSRLLDQLRHLGLEITAAGWVKAEFAARPYLYVATPAVHEADPRPPYRLVRTAVDVLEPVWGGSLERLDTIDVKLVSDRDPLAVGMAEVQRTDRTGRHATWYRGSSLGRMPLDGPAYIYPLPAPQPV
jgi:hypothetical protein